MKKNDILKLSCKNLFNNFTRFILTIITLTLISSVIVLMCNFCYYFKKTTDANILYDINKYGTFIVFGIKKDSNNNFLMNKIETKDIDDFISKAEELNLIQTYYLEYDEINSDISIFPFIGGYDDIAILKGEACSREDRNKNNIWIDEEYSISENINLGDKITITINDKDNEFIVKGITGDHNKYIDYSYFDITNIHIYENNNEYYDYSIIKTISNFKKTAPKNTAINEGSINYSGFYFVLGLCIFLVLFCVLFSLGSVLNVFNISLRESDYFIGIMKSLGMRKNNILLYVLTQMIILIMLSTVLSAFLSWIIIEFTLELQIMTVGKMFYYNKDIIKSGFNLFLPLLNFFVLDIFLLLGSLKMLKKYAAKDIIEIVEGAER